MDTVVELDMDEVEHTVVGNSFGVGKLVVEKDTVLEMDIVVAHKLVVEMGMVLVLEL